MGVSPVKDRATRSALLIAKREIAMRHHGNRAATENLAILRAFVVKPAPKSTTKARRREESLTGSEWVQLEEVRVN